MYNQNELMKCKIKITGSTGLFQAEGEFERQKDGFEIRYCLDGDHCALTYADRTLTHRRQGQASMELKFIEGEHTTGSLGEGEMIGQFEIFSELVKVSSHENGARINLRYISSGEKVELNFLAVRVRNA